MRHIGASARKAAEAIATHDICFPNSLKHINAEIPHRIPDTEFYWNSFYLDLHVRDA